jgi:DNA-binding MarR family transcriptional regulator
MNVFPDDCAYLILAAIPHVMRVIRAEARRTRFPELSMAHFRALAFVGSNTGAMVSDLADHLGLTLPSASRLADTLAEAGFLQREVARDDRRRLSLKLTVAGQRRFEAAQRAAAEAIEARLENLSTTERTRLREGIRLLDASFQAETEKPRVAAAVVKNGRKHLATTRSK